MVQHRLVSLEYFMDKMEEWEVVELYDVVGYAEYSSWEQTRLILSCYADTKKVKKLSDIIKFPWDKDGQNDKSKEMTNEQRDKLRKMSEDYAKKYFTNN